MEIEAKIENPAIKKRLNDLDSDNPRMIKEAVNYLARRDKNKQLKTALRDIVENFQICESLAAIWAIVQATSIFEIYKMFEDAIYGKNRLGAVLITKNGTKDEKPLGIITAWDLPKLKEYLA